MGTEVLQIQDLQKIFGGLRAIDGLSFSASQGQIKSVIGPNGAGKSSLLLALSCLLKSFQGEIIFRGRRVGSNHTVFDYRRNLAMVFQEPLLFDTTVFENVAAGLKIRGMRQHTAPSA